MLSYRKFGEYLDAEPFRPFLIKMASGQTFEIRHPEMILVGRASAKVYTTTTSSPDDPPHWHDILLLLTESLEPIATKSTEKQN